MSARVECNFFGSWSSNWKLGKEIAEGGHAKIYGMMETVVKVIQTGRRNTGDLQKHWPRHVHIIPRKLQTFIYWVWKATLLPDGRFAFWLQRQWGDLRQMIDPNMNIHRRHGTATEHKEPWRPSPLGKVVWFPM